MKKKLMSLALVVLLTASASVSTFAQSNNTDNGKAKIEKNDKKQRGDKGPRVCNPFEGMNLTDAQRTKLAELDKAKAEQRKQDKEAAKAARKEQGAKMKQARLDERKKYLSEVRQIIGEQNYVQFLENYYINGQCRMGKYGKFAQNRGKMHRGDKENGRKDRGQRQGKGPRAQQAAPQK